MLYLLVSIAHYRQLAKIDQELIGSIESGIGTVCARHGLPWQRLEDGSAAIPLGPEDKTDPRQALEVAFPIAAVLEEKKEELYGYQLLLAVLEELPPAAAVRQLKRLLAGCEEDGELWIEAGAIGLFAGVVDTRRAGELWKVTERVLPREAVQVERALAWVQERVVFQASQALSGQLEGKREGRGLYLFGPVSQDRRGVVDALQERLAGTAAVRRFPRLYALFQRRSALHPFLNSLDPAFLPNVAHYLKPHERAVWDSLSDLLSYLRPPVRRPPRAAPLSPGRPSAVLGWQEGWPEELALRGKPAGAPPAGHAVTKPGELWPDHLAEDFLLSYQLYLIAYFRMLEENFLPAVLICEDIDSYHSATLRTLAVILKDCAQLPSFLPIFSSAEREVPEILTALNPFRLAVRPLRLAEMGRLAAEQYPGLRVPRQDWLRIRLAARGKPVSFQHCLLTCERRGLIQPEEGEPRQYRWQAGEGWEKALPKRPLTLSWQVVGRLAPELQRLLYLVYLCQGLLDLPGLLQFLVGLGLPERQSSQGLMELAGLGLVHLSNHAVPAFPALRKRLRQRVTTAEPGLEERLLEHLIELWRTGAFPHRVLLFFLLTKSRHTATAFEVLGELLKHKLDELDFAGVRIFLEPKNFRLNTALGAEEQKNLAMLLGAVRIRYHLLTGARKEAEAAYLTAVDLGSDYQVSPLKGELFLQIARYLATRGETHIALQWVKKAVLQFQGAGSAVEEREATVELGGILLADGRLAEALEYFNLAGQADSLAPSVGEVRLAALRATVLFIQGNLSRAQTETQIGLQQARALKRREWELFLGFLAARVLFELGSYTEAAIGFQQALATETLYPSAPARGVLYAWLARAVAYAGSPGEALRLLGQLKESWEVCLFEAEASFFGRELGRALDFCNKALSLDLNPEFFPGERVVWTDGFSDVEGRCLVLAKDGAMALRLIQSLQAYLWGLQGSVERASEQLHAITRSGHIPEADPYQSLYNFWYSSILPDLRQDELDDRLTVLNKALQLLQQRASRIEDSTLRWHYLNNNRWNAGLFAEARQRKLI
jgi:tetratricopeptide (TPR) repeat protein